MDSTKKAEKLEALKARARELGRALGAMREGGHETDREALRREIASVDRAIEALDYRPLEVAYRLPGKAWVRRVCATQAALDRLLARLEGEGAEVLTRDADGQ